MNKDNEKSMKKSNRMYWTGDNKLFGWRIFIAFILIWIIVTYFIRQSVSDKTEISYTEFKQNISGQNISEVTIKGNLITGEFKSPYKKITDGDTATYISFITIIPPVDDPRLIESLEENGVIINAEVEEETSWWFYFLILMVPWVLILFYFYFVRKKIQGQFGSGVFGIGKSRAKKFRKEKVSITFNDIAGLENAKADLKEIIAYMKSPDKFSNLGADIPNGILLMGPPGTGKTMLAKATAGEADVSFFSLSGSEFIEMFVGVGASRVRDLFEQAKKSAPSVIFIDEIDSIGRSRGTGLGGGHDEREQTLNQILNEMDGFEPNQSVVVMAATNRPDVLDPALVRPGRFDRRITLDLPMKKARKKILEIHTRKVPLGEDVNLENIASRTIGFSGAELKNLVNEAALLAGRDKKDKVEKEDFEKARDKILLGSETEELIDDDEKKLVAYHEAGHALVAKYIEGADPLEKVTIIPRGRTLGVTEQMPEIERRNYRKSYLLAKIAVTLGGRASEKIVFGDVSNGAANDFMQVTDLARKMVCLWGMSEKLGPVFYKQGEEHPFLGREMARQKDFSEHTQQIIDDEIKKILTDMEQKAESILERNRVQLDALAEALMENEILDKKQIDWILEKVEEGVEA